MNTYKTQNHPFLKDGIEGKPYASHLNPKSLSFEYEVAGEPVLSIYFYDFVAKSASKNEWFAPVIDYKAELERMGWKPMLLISETKVGVLRGTCEVRENSYEAIYNMLKPGEKKEPELEMIGRADNPVTLEEIQKYTQRHNMFFEFHPGCSGHFKEYILGKSCKSFSSWLELSKIIRS